MENITFYNKLFVVVGAGGTGSLIARDIPKLMIDSKCKMLLIDGDNVERKNMKRQSYQEQDIGENKAISLSKKINALYGPICYTYDKYLTNDELFVQINKLINHNTIPIIIGCVDNDSTRKILERNFIMFPNAVYMDSANSEYEGNIFVSLRKHNELIGALRSQSYDLEEDMHPLDISCQEQAANNTQFLVTNLKMATALFEHCDQIMKNKVKVGVTCVKRFETIHY